MPGRIIREVRGTGGFGYDVVFEADEHPGVTTAELSVPTRTRSATGAGRWQLAPQVAARLAGLRAVG